MSVAKTKAMPRAKLTKLLIEELSHVDAGAQAAQGTVILKRAPDGGAADRERAAAFVAPGQVLETAAAVPPPTAIAKRSVLTSAAMGHTHLLMGVDDSMAGTTTSERTWSGSSESYGYHSHPWVRDDAGTITIGEAAGHTHEVQSSTPIAKREETEMTTTQKTQNEERLEAELAKARAYGDLTDVQKLHYAGLGDAAKDAFLKAAPAERDTSIAKALEADPVIVEVDGVPYRKSAGPAMIALAKKARAAEEDRAALELERLEKRAVQQLGNLPKTNKVKVAVLQAVDKIADEETRKEALEMLTAANEHAVAVTKNIGHGGKPGATTELEAFNAKLVEFAKAKNKSPEQATADFIVTDEGAQLYAAAFPTQTPS
jgi:hypothetical protein